MTDLFGVKTVDGRELFINPDHISTMDVGKEGCTLHFTNGVSHNIKGEYIMTLIEDLKEITITPIGDPEEVDINDTEYVDESIDDLLPEQHAEV